MLLGHNARVVRRLRRHCRVSSHHGVVPRLLCLLFLGAARIFSHLGLGPRRELLLLHLLAFLRDVVLTLELLATGCAEPRVVVAFPRRRLVVPRDVVVEVPLAPRRLELVVLVVRLERGAF